MAGTLYANPAFSRKLGIEPGADMLSALEARLSYLNIGSADLAELRTRAMRGEGGEMLVDLSRSEKYAPTDRQTEAVRAQDAVIAETEISPTDISQADISQTGVAESHAPETDVSAPETMPLRPLPLRPLPLRPVLRPPMGYEGPACGLR